MDGWYFSDETERLRHGDGRGIAAGVTHTVRCKPELCVRGLHASRHVLDALAYAHSPILWRVTLGGRIVHGDDKSCATERTYHARLDATDVLGAFARECALEVIHLWEAPPVVRRFLETGDESLRDAAWAASDTIFDAARSAASDAAKDAAYDAAYYAACKAARNAACNARDAAQAAAYDAAWDARAAAYAAARDAAWVASAANSASYAAARDAAWAASAAAKAAAYDARRSRLDQLVKGEFDV